MRDARHHAGFTFPSLFPCGLSVKWPWRRRLYATLLTPERDDLIPEVGCAHIGRRRWIYDGT